METQEVQDLLFEQVKAMTLGYRVEPLTCALFRGVESPLRLRFSEVNA